MDNYQYYFLMVSLVLQSVCSLLLFSRSAKLVESLRVNNSCEELWARERRSWSWHQVSSTACEMSASFTRLAHKLLQISVSSVFSVYSVGSVCTNLISLAVWGSLDTASLSAFNILVLPLLQLAMSAITEKIQKILRSRIKTETDPSSNTEEQMNENRIKLRYRENILVNM